VNTLLHAAQVVVMLLVVAGVVVAATHLARAATPGLVQLLEAVAPMVSHVLARVRRALSRRWK
jgi:hypothetical protein